MEQQTIAPISETTDRILLIPKAFFGDMILLSPAIEMIKRAHPASYLCVVCPPSGADLFRFDPFVDEVIVFDRREEFRGLRGVLRFAHKLRSFRFDRVYSFQRSPRTGLLMWLARIPARIGYSDVRLPFLYTERVSKSEEVHEVIRILELVKKDLGVEDRMTLETLPVSMRLHGGEPWDPPAREGFARIRIYSPPDGELSERVREILSDPKPYVVLSPGSAWATKRWHARGFNEVARSLISWGIRVVIVGSKADTAECEAAAADLPAINVCGETSLQELIAIVRDAACVVCNDSMALHLASALKRPVVAIFCATSPRFGFGPWQNRSVVLERSDLFCKPCSRHGSLRCPQGTETCMTGVASRDVLSAVGKLLVEEGHESGFINVRRRSECKQYKDGSKTVRVV